MLKYIIRLDDASPYMNVDNWRKMEILLNKYNIKPIVGVIPDCKDESFLKLYTYNEEFWKKDVNRWVNNGWVLAQHGHNHELSEEVRTEFKGKSVEEQEKIIKEGYEKMLYNGVKPCCFFAPAHTFDKNTIKACSNLDFFEFISDGYAFYPYEYKKMMFLPSVFDTPHKISKNGIFTFVFHPNNLDDQILNNLESFIIKHKDHFEIDILATVKKYSGRKKSIKDFSIHLMIYVYRWLRKLKRKIFNNKG